MILACTLLWLSGFITGGLVVLVRIRAQRRQLRDAWERPIEEAAASDERAFCE